MRLAGHVARTGRGEVHAWVLVGKPDGKTPLGRSGNRWEDDIKMNTQEVKLSSSSWGEAVGFCENGTERFSLHKLQGSSWIAEERLGFKERLCSMTLIVRNIQTLYCCEESGGSEWKVGRDVR